MFVVSGCGGGGYGGGSNQAVQPAPSTASITAPTTAPVNRTVPLTAVAIADSGLNRVEFLVDGNVIATDTTAPPARKFCFAEPSQLAATGTSP